MSLPREVWIASLTMEGIHGSTCAEVIQSALDTMSGFLPSTPDIFCLPETFHYWNLAGARPPVEELAAHWERPIVEAMSGFARAHRCYLIVPIHTGEDGRCYNAAVVIDRDGNRLGEYRKVHATEEEMALGVTPGPVDPPVFQADFGTIGIQICFDIEWPHGWQSLHRKGARMVFWPSAFGGGRRVNALAWLNNCCVVSSTARGTTKICDLTGDAVAESGRWNPFGVCACINLEKAMVHTWPYVERFPAIERRYGRAIRITSLHEEEFSVIESRSPEVKIADVLREFQIPSFEAHLLRAEAEQQRRRT